MKTMNKNFKYKGYNFNMLVELNYKIEKKVNGKIWHRLTTNCMGGNNYHQRIEIESNKLEEIIKKEQELAEYYVDKLLGHIKSEDEILLEKLGFY